MRLIYCFVYAISMLLISRSYRNVGIQNSTLLKHELKIWLEKRLSIKDSKCTFEGHSCFGLWSRVLQNPYNKNIAFDQKSI